MDSLLNKMWLEEFLLNFQDFTVNRKKYNEFV